MPVNAVNIQPGVSVLSVLRHLNYRPWFALAEFVDNALQSYLADRERLEALHGPDFQFTVSIAIDNSENGRITVRDNAAGIDTENYARAFRPAAVPTDRSGLSEFGMGMKSAACWWSPCWSVRTSALGEPYERRVFFDIARIVHDDLSELDVDETPCSPDTHFTEIVLERLHRLPVKRTLGKIKDHLTDIYRVFLRNHTMTLKWNEEKLEYIAPKILKTPYFRDEDGPPILWRKEVAFDFGDDMEVTGFAAIREIASTSTAGFALFRRDRLIQGSADEPYRPESIFGKPNSYRYQRLFGELHLKGIAVAQTKDGIRWDENEQPFLELLYDHLDSDEMPMIREAEGYRARSARSAIQEAAKNATHETAESIRRSAGLVATEITRMPPVEDPPPADLPKPSTLATAERHIEVTIGGQLWQVTIELCDDPAVSDWLDVAFTGAASRPGEARTLRLRLSLAHPFMLRFSGAGGEAVEPLVRVAAATALAEVLARESGVKLAGTVRRNINEILRKSLSRP